MSGWVPEDQRDTSWYLFNVRFRCNVSQAAMRTIDDIKQFGVPSTYDRNLDREMEQLPTTRMLNIAQMEDIFNRGYAVGVASHNDTKRIYEIVQDHLTAFQHFFITQSNNRVDEKTMDELDRLNVFASNVYAHAKKVIRGQYTESLFGQLRRKHNLVNILSRRDIDDLAERATVKGTSQEKPQEDESQKYPERHDFGSLLERQRRMGERTWK